MIIPGYAFSKDESKIAAERFKILKAAKEKKCGIMIEDVKRSQTRTTYTGIYTGDLNEIEVAFLCENWVLPFGGECNFKGNNFIVTILTD